MTKRMLIDATHAEETRVVVLDGNRLEDFDVETSTKRQIKGNIYLAKVVRVEPSLQAAFVEYGGGRHGFLAFGEIHPDYYQIPVADRQRLLAMQAEEARAEQEDEDEDDEPGGRAPRRAAPRVPDEPSDLDMTTEPDDTAEPTRLVADAAAVLDEPDQETPLLAEAPAVTAHPPAVDASEPHDAAPESIHAPAAPEDLPPSADPESEPTPRAQPASIPHEVRFGATTYGREEFGATVIDPAQDDQPEIVDPRGASEFGPSPFVQPGYSPRPRPPRGPSGRHMPAADAPAADAPLLDAPTGNDAEFGDLDIPAEEMPPPEIIGGESDTFEGNGAEEARARRSSRFLRNYRIQEVIRRRQILLVQVVKEERGTKGAALTTYISLAGRFCVLMPNSPKGGGISRKITSAADRRRLKEITAELEIPQGMGLIVRTAGAARPKPEIKRDCEYLMRLWDDIRETTMKSVAPAAIHEEASLIKRSIRDVYSRDVDEILVDGEEGWRSAHDFMRMLMPSHAKKVQLWRRDLNGGQPLFSKSGVEQQLDAMMSPTVQLRSGGYLVINQAEALVAIDVNSGRSTRERGIEETALRTNLEAADEVARQLRLRDLAGLIVIDFIDMESRRNNAAVERRLKDALKNDRARIQVGSISHFGLMEMSRQRLRPSLAESSFVQCPHCGGIGHVRGVESSAVHVLREIEDEGAKGRASLIMVYVANAVAMYILNQKRARLAEIEQRYAMQVHFTADETLVPPAIRIDRLRAAVPEHERPVLAAPIASTLPPPAELDDSVEEPDLEFTETDADVEETAEETPADHRDVATSGVPETAEEAEKRRRRRRRRRGGRKDGAPAETNGELAATDAGGDVGPGPVTEYDSAEPIGTAEGPTADPGDVAAGEMTSVEPGEQTELDENGQPKARRRGRRGGRRRRRDGGPNEADNAADDALMSSFVAPVVPVPVVPSYSGPTPADPFGGAPFDIFDLMEQAENAAAARPTQMPARMQPVEQGSLDIPPVPAHATEPKPEVEPESLVEPEPEPAPVEETMAIAAAPKRDEPPAPEPVVGPATKPILVGQDPLPDAAPKRGWWRR